MWLICQLYNIQVYVHRLTHTAATQLLNAGCKVTSIQKLLGHRKVETTLGYARLYDGTIAADYYQAMALIEKGMDLPEDQVQHQPSHGELIALVDSLRTGTLNEAQQEAVRKLRAGIMTLSDKEVLQETRVEV